MRGRSLLLALAGVLLLAASVAHLQGWRQFDAALEGVEPGPLGGLHVGWVWGSVAFAAFGAIVVAAAVGWRRGRDPRPAAVPVALALLAFGLWAYLTREFNPHFLGFVAMGALVGAPLLGRIEARG